MNEVMEKEISVNYNLNQDEVRVLKECSRESFYYRSLPLAMVGMAAVHFAGKKGYVKSPTWKLLGAGFGGLVVGKLSYYSECQEKVLKLTNSPLADRIRKRRGIPAWDSFEEKSERQDVEKRPDKSSSINMVIDTNVRHPEGLDDMERPSLDRDVPMAEDMVGLKGANRQTTYDELRRQNREEYERKQMSPAYRSIPPSSPQQQPASQNHPAHREFAKPGTMKENQYGDVWEQ